MARPIRPWHFLGGIFKGGMGLTHSTWSRRVCSFCASSSYSWYASPLPCSEFYNYYSLNIPNIEWVVEWVVEWWNLPGERVHLTDSTINSPFRGIKSRVLETKPAWMHTWYAWQWVAGWDPRQAATVNQQHPPVHHEGWMVSGEETVFCWVPVQ